jgi:HK97 family phage prohead protease
MTDSRAAAAAAGTLASNRGEARRQEFKSEMRSSTTTVGDKEFVVLDGYASVVGTPYKMYDFFGEYNEIIDPHAFDATLAANPDVNFLINHSGLSMARTTAGTLDLNVDETGLHSVARLNPQRTDVQDLRHAVDDGALDEMSFAFRIVDGQWSPDYSEYTITQIDLDRGDVSAVNYGANPYTSISARAKQVFEGLAHLDGEPLRIAASRAAARIAETERGDGTITGPGAITLAEAAKRRPNLRTLRARLELEDER